MFTKKAGNQARASRINPTKTVYKYKRRFVYSLYSFTYIVHAVYSKYIYNFIHVVYVHTYLCTYIPESFVKKWCDATAADATILPSEPDDRNNKTNLTWTHVCSLKTMQAIRKHDIGTLPLSFIDRMFKIHNFKCVFIIVTTSHFSFYSINLFKQMVWTEKMRNFSSL